MYSIHVAAAEFKGTTTVAQHRAVAAALKSDVGDWHGFQLTTATAE